MHIEQFIRLAETIPRSVVFAVNIYRRMRIPSGKEEGVINHTNGSTVRFDCGMRVLEFHVLVAKECPRRKIGPIEISRTAEVLDCLLMLRPDRIVIAWQSKRAGQLPS
jgi:hypothetical protein